MVFLLSDSWRLDEYDSIQHLGFLVVSSQVGIFHVICICDLDLVLKGSSPILGSTVCHNYNVMFGFHNIKPHCKQGFFAEFAARRN